MNQREIINQIFEDEVKSMNLKLNGFQENSNLTISLIKKTQKDKTQEKLNSAHLLHYVEPQEGFHNRDVNLYLQLGDYLDLLKPRDLVVIKFVDVPDPIFVN